MTETHATIPPTADVFPPGRYGRRRSPRRRQRWLAGLLALVTVVAGVLIAFRLYRQYGDPMYDAKVISYTDITDTQIVVDFEVIVPPGGSAICSVRARSYDAAEVGYAEVRVDAAPGERTATGRHRLATTTRPAVAEVLRCWAAD